MSKGIVICLYSTSGLVEQPFLDAGYEVWSFDGQNTDEDIGNWHKRWAWFSPVGINSQATQIVDRVLQGGDPGRRVVLVVGFPECTDLAVSGSRHFARKIAADPDCQKNATELAKLVEAVGNAASAPWFAENPRSVLSTLWRKPNFRFHPYEYGEYLPVDDVHPLYPEIINARDAYPKETFLWSGNGFTLPPKKPVQPPCNPDGTVAYSEQYKKLGGKSLRTKNIRSATPRGFAIALCEQLESMP